MSARGDNVLTPVINFMGSSCPFVTKVYTYFQAHAIQLRYDDNE